LRRVLTSPKITGVEKRDLVARAVDRVVCQKDGADVYFYPDFIPSELVPDGSSLPTRKSMLTELMQ